MNFMRKRARPWQPDIYDRAKPRPAFEADIVDQARTRPVGGADSADEAPTPSRRRRPAVPPRPTGTIATLTAPEDEDFFLAEELPVVVGATPPAPAVVVAAPPPRQGDNSALLGLVMGALVGAGLALLVTPASGAEIRRKLGLNSSDSFDETIVAQNMPNIEVSGPIPPATGEQNR
jgi:hypothetical protein